MSPDTILPDDGSNRQSSESAFLPVVYNPPNSDQEISLTADVEHRTIWATQRQIADAFDLALLTVNEQISNFKRQRGPSASGVIRKFRITAADGKSYEVEHYNITVITFVGYRAQATERTIAFQDWAGRVLEEAIRGSQPASQAELALIMAQQLVEQERRVREIEAAQQQAGDRLHKLEAKVDSIEEGAGYLSVLAYFKWKELGRLTDSAAQSIGQRASNLAKRRGIARGKVPDKRYGYAHTYPIELLDEVVGAWMQERDHE